MTGTNWAGNLTYGASALLEPASVEELCELVTSTHPVRALGTRHSFNRIADTDGAQISVAALPAVVEVDDTAREVTVSAGDGVYEALAGLGDDLRFVLITSAARLERAPEGGDLLISVVPSAHAKCERCWHYRADVGHDTAHPTLCKRCTDNLFGAGEQRSAA